jgi:hypothetical protein
MGLRRILPTAMFLTSEKQLGDAIVLVGGSLRDIQLMAGHSNLQTTQRYIEMDTTAQRRVVDLV